MFTNRFIYSDHDGTEQPHRDPLASPTYEAHCGDRDAQYAEADTCWKLRMTRDQVHWLTLAADQGQAQAQYVLATIYDNGTHVEKDSRKMGALLGNSSKKGLSVAQYELAKIILNKYKNSVEEMKTILGLLNCAAARENRNALYELSLLYKRTETAEHQTQSMQYLINAAMLGHTRAQSSLGTTLVDGRGGIDPNIAEGVAWARIASEKNHPAAQILLDDVEEQGMIDLCDTEVEHCLASIRASLRDINPYSRDLTPTFGQQYN